MAILTQFIFRLSFGLAVAMACTSSRQVTSGYFRVHSYVLLGLNVLATMVALGAPDRFSLWPPLLAAVCSYVASVCWLYESQWVGKAALAAVALVTIAGAWLSAPLPISGSASATGNLKALAWLDPVAGGLVLGVTIAAMLLGHWYLNTPTMQLAPLKRLVLLLGIAVVVRAVLCGIGLALEIQLHGPPDANQTAFLALRWLSGLIGTLLLAGMAWQTLKIPNTQSATGILYVAVIATFLGELTSQLLSAETAFPL